MFYHCLIHSKDEVQEQSLAEARANRDDSSLSHFAFLKKAIK